MISKKTLWASLAAFGLLLGTTSDAASAEMLDTMTKNTSQFHRIEQPLVLKVGVTIGGLTLIGLELWWFLFHKRSES
jgi:plastocyanin domain-containing protein